jgi:Xaa-Pro aminopeptidase
VKLSGLHARHDHLQRARLLQDRAFGIRIENLILVIEAAPVPHSEKPLNAFETLTLAPIDRRLIDTALMTAEERAWVDANHARVVETIGPLVDGETRAWLKAATEPLPAV